MPNSNLRVLGLIARKGGSGKTTLCRALTSAAVAAGRRVLLIDTDPTAALSGWYQRAEMKGFGSALLSLRPAETVAQVAELIDEAWSEDSADLIVVDTAGGGAEWSDAVAVLCDHLITPVMLSQTDFDVGTQTVTWYQDLRTRVDDPDSLPRHHVVLTMVEPRPTKADAQQIAEAMSRFPVVETMMMRRNIYKEMDRLGLLQPIGLARQADPNPLLKPHVRPVFEALEEAMDILNDILTS